MIESYDRSGYFGASDTDKIVGKWTSNTWLKWWLQKLAVNNDRFDNVYTLAGTHFEHRVLQSLGIPMQLDRQIILEDLRLRVNLDGNTDDCIYECKTYKADKPFELPRKYVNQVNVQMYASGLRQAKIVVYGLMDKDYLNFFGDIDPNRRKLFDIPYDEHFINNIYLPRLIYLAECLKRGIIPGEADK